MKVKIQFTVDVDDEFRRALNAYYDKPGLATRQEIQSWYKDNASSIDADLMDEYRKAQEVGDDNTN